MDARQQRTVAPLERGVGASGREPAPQHDTFPLELQQRGVGLVHCNRQRRGERRGRDRSAQREPSAQDLRDGFSPRPRSRQP